MNILDPRKARQLYGLFSYGHGIREAARVAKVSRGTGTRYHREWLLVRSDLQRAYDALWEGDAETCDAINEPLPEPAVLAMFDAWVDDQADLPKSGFHAGFEPEPTKPNPLLTIRDPGRLSWYGWKSPLPSYVVAAESLWVLWREQFVGECTLNGRRHDIHPRSR